MVSWLCCLTGGIWSASLQKPSIQPITVSIFQRSILKMHLFDMPSVVLASVGKVDNIIDHSFIYRRCTRMQECSNAVVKCHLMVVPAHSWRQPRLNLCQNCQITLIYRRSLHVSRTRAQYFIPIERKYLTIYERQR